MKKNMLSLIALVALFCLLPGLLFAQGSTDSAKASNPVSIELWYGAAITEAGPPPSDWVGFSVIRDKLNIDLKLTALPSNESDQDVKIQAAAAANNLPDLFMVRRDVLVRLVGQGLVAPVDDLYAKMPVRTMNHYDSVSMAMARFNGKSYGLSDPGSIARNEGLLIRKDWLDNLGLAEPKTMEDLMQVMKAFTFNDPDRNGKNDTWGYGAFQEINNFEAWPGRRLEPIFGAFGVDGTWDMTTAKAGLNILKPEFYNAMVYLKQMVDEGVIDPNWLAYKKDDFRAAWKQGRFGIMREQNAAFAAQSNYAPFDKNFPQGNWIVLDPPKGPQGYASIGPYTANFRIYAISGKAAKEGKTDKIAELLEWMASDEGYYLLGWGVEGVNYTKDVNGIPVAQGLPDENLAFSAPGGQTVTQLRNLVFYNGDIELYARYPKYITDVSKKEMSALTALRDMQKRTWTPAIGSDTLPIPNADLKRFYEQGLSEFITGKRTINAENWKKWIDEFKKLGGQEWNDKGVAFAQDNNLLN
jgi:putative aldouronate transport system substrate-binding protein